MQLEQNNLVWSLLDQHLLSDTRNAPAVTDETETVTYLELHQRVLSFTRSSLFSADMPAGSRVVCMVEDSIHLVVILLGLMRRGLVPCIVNPNLSTTACADVLETAQPACVITTASCYKKAAPILTAGNIACHVLHEEMCERFSTYQDLPVPVSILEDAFGVFTSGTTGKPDLVIHRHQDARITCETYVKQVLGVTKDDVLFSTSKLFFAYGLNSLLYALMHGATAILSPADNTLGKLWQIITRHKPSIVFSVPTMYLRLLDYPQRPHRLEYVRLCVSAGEHLPVQLYRDWHQHFRKRILDGIGTTEMLSTFISNTAEQYREGSTGKLIAGFKAEIRDEHHTALPAGQTGVLWVKGDTCPCSYVNHAEMSRKRFVDGWFKTEDMFSCDEEGFYYCHGRANDLIKCGGLWIFPQRIEVALNRHPMVLESAVIGEKQHGLLRPAAFVILKKAVDDPLQVTAELKEYCKVVCSKHEYPHSIYFVDDLPKTASGKLQRFQLERGV